MRCFFFSAARSTRIIIHCFLFIQKKKLFKKAKPKVKHFFFFFTGEFENETCLELRLSREANV
jgi:hypothetical protein